MPLLTKSKPWALAIAVSSRAQRGILCSADQRSLAALGMTPAC
ncbi:MAG: hypothetical protein OJF58_005280 [Enhydrobacter sp.]|nr:MAG: hypothetical protein OJF58_005280 [Enhydrobacter sp.]